jgi:hypothetical protein
MLEQAFPGPVATPDYLAHDCERAERALLSIAGRQLVGADPKLLRLLALSTLSTLSSEDAAGS